MKLFDEICAAKKQKSFSSFCSPSDEERENPPKRGKYREPWFSCRDGAKIVSTLIDAIKNEKDWTKKGPFPLSKREVEILLYELNDLKHCLELGSEHRATFYIAIA